MGQDIAAKLVHSLEHMFDFAENYELGEMIFPLYGRYFRRNSRYFAVKKVEIYAFSNFEHIFLYRAASRFSEREFDSVLAHLKERIDEIVKPNHEHMSTVITLIVECDSADESLVRKIQKFKYRKSFRFGFQGWADIKVIVAEHLNARAIESKLARGDAKRLKLFE